MQKKYLISGLLCLVAIGIIMVSLNPRLYAGRVAQLLAQHQNKQQSIMTGKVTAQAQYDGVNVTDVNLKQLRADMRSKEAVVLRGYVAIPALGVDMPIFEGTTAKNLALGAGTLKAHEVMGQRNYAIGAHNMADNRTYFSPLQNKFQVGTKIYVTDGHSIYIYQSVAKRVVSQYQVEVIADRPKQSASITLLTCFEEPPYYTNATKRVVITGKLVAKQSVSEKYLRTHHLFKALQ